SGYDLLLWFFAALRYIRVFFFFSSRRRHTRCYRDWSSDVCSSDLAPPAARPSMVVTCLPTAALTGVTQERTALPSMCTVQAPHRAIPQPYLVPVRPTCSRIAHNRGVLGSTLTSLAFPLIVRRAIGSP